MKTNLFPLIVVLICMLFSYCEKTPDVRPPDDNQDTLIGNWQLVDMKVVSESRVYTETPTEKTNGVQRIQFVAKDLSGNFTFTTSAMIFSNFSYRIDTVRTYAYYTLPPRWDSYNIWPFKDTIQSYADTASYQKSGNDSLYFDSWPLVVPSGSGYRRAPFPCMAKRSFSGDTLVLSIAYSQTDTLPQSDNSLLVKSERVNKELVFTR